MTSPARRRNVDLRNGRLRIRGRQNVVTLMAIRADRRGRVTARVGFRVNAFSIRQERAIADPAALHDRLVAVTAAAGLGDVGSIDC